jgi:hypothetical protein
LSYKASDGSDLSPFTPFLFLPDVRELGVKVCGFWDAKSLNKKIDFCKSTAESKKAFCQGCQGLLVHWGKPRNSYRKM